MSFIITYAGLPISLIGCNADNSNFPLSNSTQIRDQKQAIALLGRSSAFCRMLSTIRSRVLSIAKMRTIGGGLCVGLFQGVCLKLCAIAPNQ
ncbi:hypothetical protein QUB08_29820 [Microcoleus sp. BR0-C5]|uniref:hypothetical protein n=1 Tax=Microcoleus sp. BR0-C5 TaxID=2818713 RepID=UPI002FD20215